MKTARIPTQQIMRAIMSSTTSGKEKMTNAVHLALAVASGHRGCTAALKRARTYGLGTPTSRATIIIAQALADHYMGVGAGDDCEGTNANESEGFNPAPAFDGEELAREVSDER